MADAPQPQLTGTRWGLPLALFVLIGAGFVAQSLWPPLTDLFCLQPREIEGLAGVLFAPVLHSGILHLTNNLVGLLPSTWLLAELYPRRALSIITGAWLATGVLVWVLAPAACIIGASGVVYALLLFLLTGGILGRDRQRWALVALLLFLNQGFVWGFLPLEPGVSWQSHLMGGLVGVALALRYRTQPLAGQPPVVTDDSPLPPEVWDYRNHLPDEMKNEK